MEKKRFTILLLTINLCFPILSSAETVVLKSGQTIEGKIIEKTDEYIKIDFEGVPLTYFMDEIDKVEGSNSFSANEEKKKGSLVIVGDATLTYASYFFVLPPNWFPAINNTSLALTHKKGFWRGMHKNGGVILIAPTKIEGRYSPSEFINGSKHLAISGGCSFKEYEFAPSFNYSYEAYLEHCPRINRYGLIVFAKLPTHVINFNLYAPGENENCLTHFLEDFNKVIASFRWTLGLSDEEIGNMLKKI